MKKQKNRSKKYSAKDLLQMNARQSTQYKEIWHSVGKCVFCDLKKKYIIKQYKGIVLTTNLYPYINGHLMLIPKRHITHLKQLTNTEWEAIRTLQYLSKKMLKQLIRVKSVWMLYREGNLGTESDKTVEHLHIHIMPYKDGLVEWKYQPINFSPREIASMFKSADKFMNAFIKRYNRKYLKK